MFRQVRQGITTNTKGTAFVVYEDVMDAKQACDKLNGFNFQSRYLVGTSMVSTTPAPCIPHHYVETSRGTRNPSCNIYDPVLTVLILQYYIISPKRCSSQKRILKPAANL